MFQTKREQRKQGLEKYSGERHKDVKETLDKILGDPGDILDTARIDHCLDAAETRPVFAKGLDRLLGLRTDDEDQEYQAYWNTKRNKAYYVFAIASFVISVVAIVISGLSLYASWTTK